MVRIELRASQSIVAALAIVHAASAVTLLPLDLPLAAKVLLAVLIVASLAHGIWRHAILRSREALIALEIREKGETFVRTRTGEWHEARVLGTTYISPPLTAINVLLAGRNGVRHMILVRDNCEPDAFRRLRVRLRWSSRRTDET